MNMNRLTTIFLVLAALTMTVACSSFDDDSNPYGVEEAVKDLSGTWKLKTVTRNGSDITSAMDFTKFSLKLNNDGSYSLENYLPFVVSKDGTWAVNDPKHPFMITFTETGSAAPVALEFDYPMVNGQRAISITLSPGCYSNSYVYTMYRVNNQ